ncbi:MAG: hypothetical protein KJ645_09555, partial [Planctomycetes bacterium]|nr:hypothetical protein [Planctomycetota bacterium]
IETFEYLAAEAEDEEKIFEFQSKAAAAANNYAHQILSEVREILSRNLSGYTTVLEYITEFVFDLHHDYETDTMRTLLADRLTPSIVTNVIELAARAKEQYRNAYSILKEYSFKPFSNPVAAVFLVNILYRSHKPFPALLEATLALKGPLPTVQRNELLQTMANIYREAESYSEEAEIQKTLMAMAKAPALVSAIRRKIIFADLKGGKYDQVIAEVKPLLQTQNFDLLLIYCLGRAYQEKGDIEQAIPRLLSVSQAITKGISPPYIWNSPIREEVFEKLCDAFCSKGDFTTARTIMQQAVSISPSNLDFRRRRAWLLSKKTDQGQSAITDYDYLVKHGPRDSEIFEKWLQCFDDAYRTFNGVGYRQRAQQLIDRYDRKVLLIGTDVKRLPELYEASTFPETKGDIGLRITLIRELIDRGRREEGKGLLRMLVRTETGFVELAYQLGLLYYQEGEEALAVKEFEKVRERDPTDIQSIKRMIRCCRRLNDTPGEMRLIRTVLDENDELLSRWLLARLNFEEGKSDNFLRIYQTLENFPDAMQTDLDLMAAKCFINESRLDEAFGLIQDRLKKEPRDIEALITWTNFLLSCPGEMLALFRGDQTPSRVAVTDETRNEGLEEIPAEETDESGAARPEGEPSSDDKTPEVVQAPAEDPKSSGAKAPEAELPEELWNAVDVVAILHGLGMKMSPHDLEILSGTLLDQNRSDLVLNLMEGIELPFPLTPKIYRSLAKAYQLQRRYREAANTLVVHTTSVEDLRWAGGMALSSDDLTPLSRSIIQWVENRPGLEERGEFFLRAAASAALEGGIPETNQNLEQALRYTT